MDYLIGHLIGDYLLQNDFMAMNKKANTRTGWLACFVHCLLYTAAVCVCTGWWKPYLIGLVFLSHFPFDKTYIIARYMKAFGAFRRVLEGQEDMNHKTWAYLLVDNTVHLALLWLIAKFAV
jgi:hypothetical protein